MKEPNTHQDEPLVIVENLSKKFCKDLKTSLWYGVKDLWSGVMGNKNERLLRNKEFWAVKDISFTLRRGECLGLIGHNGAGKSTLLKILNGLINPDAGKVTIKGRVGALIELGAGFNPILSGRENIYNNGAILGFSRKEIDSKLEEIIAFAELEEFIDMPVQNYSSGMKVRLGFAVAAQMEPDVLIIDEVLAVGDLGFVLKCFNQMDKLLQKTAIILVSHNIPQIARMSSKLLLLENGKDIYNSNDISTGLNLYYSKFTNKISDFSEVKSAEMTDVNLIYNNKKYNKEDEIFIDYNSPISIEIEIFCKVKIRKPNLYLAFYDVAQRGFGEVMNFREDIHIDEIEGSKRFKVELSNLNFALGRYSFSVTFSGNTEGYNETIFRNQSVLYFNITNSKQGWAPIQFDAKWEHESSFNNN